MAVNKNLEHVHNHQEHEHQHTHPQSKYEQALAKYNCNIKDEDVVAIVKKIITEKVHENDTLETKKFLFGSIELTTLKTTDSEDSVMAFTEKVNQFDEAYAELPHVATICVYPCYAKTVSETLEIDGVEIACVAACFPSSQSFPEIKIAETALALKDGATEIDIVMPVGKFLSGDYEGMCDEISELKSVCGEHSMKVILETGCPKTVSNIKKASILSMYAGADYIKTSTGKEKISATPEAAYVPDEFVYRLFKVNVRNPVVYSVRKREGDVLSVGLYYRAEHAELKEVFQRERESAHLMPQVGSVAVSVHLSPLCVQLNTVGDVAFVYRPVFPNIAF